MGCILGKKDVRSRNPWAKIAPWLAKHEFFSTWKSLVKKFQKYDLKWFWKMVMNPMVNLNPEKQLQQIQAS